MRRFSVVLQRPDMWVGGRHIEMIKSEKARALAATAATEAGYEWIPPVRVSHGVCAYYVTANWRSRGGAVRVKIDRRDGTVLQIWVGVR
jgi:hypothetical protein